MREVCAQVLLNDPPRIGRPNTTVEVDKSLFVKRTANVGRIPEAADTTKKLRSFSGSHQKNQDKKNKTKNLLLSVITYCNANK